MDVDELSCSCFVGGVPTSSPTGLRSRGAFGARFRLRRQRRKAASMITTMKIRPTAIPALAPVESPVLVEPRESEVSVLDEAVEPFFPEDNVGNP